MKVVVVPFAFNEGEKIKTTLDRIPRDRGWHVMVMDDGSTDGSLDDPGVEVLRNETNMGVGFSMKRVLHHVREQGFDVIVILAGNNKDEPEEIPALLGPIESDEADLVQGSRYLPGGGYGNTPFYRRIATRWIHPLLFSIFARRRMTDTTNGFRAIRLSILDDEGIVIDQPWLDRYELEPYILFRAIRQGYRVAEAPCTKIYPPRAQGYTKMKPVTGWWSILRPIFLLGLGLKR